MVEVSKSPIAYLRALISLTKPRLSFLSVLTGLVGYAVAPAPFSWTVVIGLFVGMGMAAGSAAALNQWMEQKRDAMMERTRERPIPSGEVSSIAALVFGLLIGIVGLGILLATTHWLAMTLTFLTLVTYLAIYTPSKSFTPWCTAIGTIPGALPPLIGWAASEGTLSTEAWLLFIAMVAWQIPHFMALAWMYREDYAKADIPMISVVDTSGNIAAQQSLLFIIVLIASMAALTFLGLASIWFLAFSLIVGGVKLILGLRFLVKREDEQSSKQLFFFSLLYLPIVFGGLVADVLWIS